MAIVLNGRLLPYTVEKRQGRSGFVKQENDNIDTSPSRKGLPPVKQEKNNDDASFQQEKE